MKNILSVIVCTLFVLCLQACGSGGGNDSAAPPSSGGGGGTDPIVTPDPGSTPIGGALGTLQDIGDFLGPLGDGWYNTVARGMNLSGHIIASSLDIPVVWDPAQPDTLTAIATHSGSYDDYYTLKEQASKNTFRTSEIIKINDRQEIIGNTFSKNGTDESRAFVYDYDTSSFIDLAPPSYLNDSGERIFKNYSKIVDINDSGWILLDVEDEEGQFAYFWDGITFQTINDLRKEDGSLVPSFLVPRLLKTPLITGET